MFTIGEFSRIVGLSVKALRFYHEQGLLVPAQVDPQSGYRYYAPEQVEIARVIALLRGMDFPLDQIKQILAIKGDQKLLSVLQSHRAVLEAKIKDLRKSAKSLDQFIESERQAQNMASGDGQIQEKTLDAILIAGIRMKGCYSDCGKAFGTLSRTLRRHIAGKPMLLHYDTEYKEDDADFEAAMPMGQEKALDGIAVRQLPGVRCVSLVYKGPYDQLGRAYEIILKHVKEKNYRILMPTREVYLKGPGMIFKGNPKNYLTEIQIPVEI